MVRTAADAEIAQFVHEVVEEVNSTPAPHKLSEVSSTIERLVPEDVEGDARALIYEGAIEELFGGAVERFENRDKPQLSLFSSRHRFPIIAKPRLGGGSMLVGMVSRPKLEIVGKRDSQLPRRDREDLED